MIRTNRAASFLLLLLLLLLVFPSIAQLLAATICIDVDEVLDPVNPLVFGNAQPFGHGDFVLQSDSWAFDPQALELFSALSPPVLRFPGGDHADEYFWEDGIGPHHLRPQPRPGQLESFDFHYGIDEHMALCERLGAQAFITVNYASGIESDSLSFSAPLSQRASRAADWVEYCNAPNDGSNPNGGIDWAARRAENGHPQPYDVTCWEIGNEIYSGTRPYQANVDVQTYAQDVIAFSQAMKAVDPGIKIGAVGVVKPHWRSADATLLQIAHQDIDFLVVHIHYPGSWELPESAEAIYWAGLAGANQALVDLVGLRELIDQEAYSSIGIVPGENGFFAGLENFHLNASLLAGLHLADLLMMFLEQSSALTIPFACGWKLHGYGYGSDIGYQWWPEQRTPRPEYYAQRVFREHFGDLLVANSVDCGTFSTVEVAAVEAMPDVPELSVCTSIDSERTKLYVMVINKQLEGDVQATIQVEGFEPQPEASIWTLNGPSITAHNEEDPGTVSIVPSTLSLVSKSFAYTFPAHSLTVLELDKSTEDILPPTILDVTVTEIAGHSARIMWQTDKPADSRVEYGPAPGGYQFTTADSTLTEEHGMLLESLLSETQYYFRVVSCDHNGNAVSSEEERFRTLDVTPPQIAQLEVAAITETTAIISWMTDELADSRVEYHRAEQPTLALYMGTDFAQAHHVPLSGLQAATEYSFQVSSVDLAGNTSEPQGGSFTTASPRSGTTDDHSRDSMPLSYRLWQNFPNPFNASTNIRYHLPLETTVSVRIYNSLGQLVRALVEDDQPAGEYQVSWDARDDGGGEVASGVYFCCFQARDFREMCKMTLLR